MTRLVDAVARELEAEAPVTRRVLDRVPLEKRDWKPHPKSMSLGHLAAWMANAPGWVSATALESGFDVDRWTPFPAPETSGALLAAFDAGVGAARAAMAKLDDSAARGEWSFRAGGQAIRTITRLDVLRLFLLSDAIHHRGQMSVFLRLLDVPVPSIYGPSADEGPA